MTTYAVLQADVASWSAKSNLTAQIPTFIRLAEARVARKVRALEMQVNDPALVIPDTGSVALPTGFLGFRSVAISVSAGLTSSPEINYVPPDVFHELQISSNQIRGIETDSYFTIESSNLLVSPAPGTGTTIELNVTYWQRFAELTALNTTNWLLTNHFDIYLHATLAELYNFLMDTEQELKYRGLYNDAVDELHTSERRKQRSGPHIRRPRFAP